MIVSCPSCQRNYVVADDQIAGKQFRARCKSCGVEFRLDGMSSPREASTPPNKDEPAKFMSATEAFLSLRTAPPPNAGTWSVCLSKNDTRRMSTDEVVAAHAKGTVGTNVLVWKSGMPKWLRLSEVPELMSALGKPLSKSPTSAGATESASSANAETPATRANKSVKPRARTATLMGTGTPSVRPLSSIPARTGQTSPPPVPDTDEIPADAKRSALAPPPVPTFGSQPPPQGESLGNRRSVPTPPQPALEIPVDVDLPMSDAAEVAPMQANADGAAKAPAVGEQPPAMPGAAEARKPNDAESVPQSDSPSDNQVAPSASQDSAEGSGGIVLPPLQGGDVHQDDAGSIAAASSLVPARTKSMRPKTELASAQGSELARRDSRPSSEHHSNRKSEPASERDSDPAFRPRKKNRFAGMVVAMSAVGILGVLGGVAGAVYVMRTASVGQPAVSVVALQPQPATPVSVVQHAASPDPEQPARAEEVSSASPPAASAMPNPPAAVAEKGRNVGRAQRVAVSGSGSFPKPAAKTVSPPAEPAAAPVGFSAPAAAPPAPAVGAGAAPFNRESALAVLGFAASRAPTCKKPDGPKGSAKVHVTFDPSGSVVAANVAGAPLAGTPVAQCISGIFRKVKVPPFAGERVTISKDVTVPP